jgi:hypothetical protein
LKLGRVLREQSVKVIYNYGKTLLMLWAGILRRTRPWPKMDLGFHTTAPLKPSVQAAESCKKSVAVADRLVALSDGHRRFLAREIGTHESRIEVVRSRVPLAGIVVARIALLALVGAHA